jgi:hypothetical protein
MIAKCCLLATVLLLSTAATSWAQSQTGGNFGTLPSGSAASRSNGGSSSGHGHHRDSGDEEQSARSSGSGSSNGGGREIDARDVERTSPVARQASTRQH